MVQTPEGALKARETIEKRYGKDFYKNIGRRGGLKKTDKPKGFATDRERAVTAGAKGGTISRRGKSKKA